MALPTGAELFYTAMQKTRWLATIYCAISLTVSGCSAPSAGTGAVNAGGALNLAGATNVGGASGGGEMAHAGAANEMPSASPIAVVQVETVTTVQSSAGSFLSPTPEQLVPAYVERGTSGLNAEQAAEQERAKIDVALLFRSAGADDVDQALDVRLVSANTAPGSTIDHYFPHVERVADSVDWPLSISSAAAVDLDGSISPEWRGWQDFRGLAVRDRTRTSELGVPAATLDFQASGLSSPLLLTAQGESLLVTNRSSHSIARGLLIYSHPGGVAVTAIDALGPGERAVTVLGPKEHPAGVLLERARGQLTEFFAASVGSELASAMAAAKSIPFLETQGLRLVALLNDELEPVAVSYSAPMTTVQRVVISHSEILKPEEEARVLDVVKDPSLDADQALATFGRFTQAKLEFAAQSADATVSANATTLLTELRNR